jgi:hypothetical protein
MMFFGILINSYGRFSSKWLRYLGWSYIVLGITFGLMLGGERRDLWVAFNTYVGITLMAMGVIVRRQKRSEQG